LSRTADTAPRKSHAHDRRISDEETLRQEIAAWETNRNDREISVDWQFTTDDARIKLKQLYPVSGKD
jgi:predicted AAA+ superfamily ATPase